MNQTSARTARHLAGLLVIHCCLALFAFGQPAARAVRPGTFAAGAGGFLDATPPARSSILVKINPRKVASGSGGDGSARVSLLNGAGQAVREFPASVPPYRSIAVGVNGPRRDIQGGDTPFGVYRYTETRGGTLDARLGTGYGTGKVYVDDYRYSYGEMEEARPRRYLIRLHGGGSSLSNPYAPDQDLRKTVGCVRMKNEDVNTLIQLIKALPGDEPLEYIFMGGDEYLNGLATNPSLSSMPWQPTLRTALHLPPWPPQASAAPAAPASTTPATRVMRATPLRGRLRSLTMNAGFFDVTAAVGPQEADAALVELIRVFAEDEGERGRAALTKLQSHKEALRQLQAGLPSDSGLQPRIAFALCYLESESCARGAQTVTSALLHPERFTGFYAEEAAQMTSRLIYKSASERNHAQAEGLMLALFAAAPRADGALSEGLGVALSDQLRDNTATFIASYKNFFLSSDEASAAISSFGIMRTNTDELRSKVFGVLLSGDFLSQQDITRIKQTVSGIQDPSREFDKAVKDLRGKYIKPYEKKLDKQ